MDKSSILSKWHWILYSFQKQVDVQVERLTLLYKELENYEKFLNATNPKTDNSEVKKEILSNLRF